MKKDVILATSIIAWALLFLIGLILYNSNPSKGYEISVYTPLLTFWTLLIIDFSLTIIIVILILLRGNYSDNNPFAFAMILTLVSSLYAVVFVLPHLRGYVLYGREGSDTLVHIGYIRTILHSGRIDRIDDYYPAVHLIYAFLKLVMDVPIEKVTIVVPLYMVISYVFFFISLGNLVASTTSSTNKVKFSFLLFSIPLVFQSFHIFTYPSILSIYLLPLVLHFIHKLSRDSSFKQGILLVLVLTTVVIFHPMTTVNLILVFSTYIIYNLIYIRKIDRNTKIMIYFIIYLIITFEIWVLQFSRGIFDIKRIIFSWIYEKPEKTPILNRGMGLLSIAFQISYIKTIQILSIRYGTLFLRFFISLLLLFVVIKKYRSLQKNEQIYVFQLFVTITFAMLLMTKYSIEYEPIRIFRTPIVISGILSGILFSRILQNKRHKQTFIVVVMASLIIFQSMLTLINVYDSPINWKANKQLTYQERTGVLWFLTYTSKPSRLLTFSISLDEYVSYYFGSRRRKNILEGIQYLGITTKDLDNIINNKKCNYTTTRYLILTEADKKIYMAFPPEFWQHLTKYLKKGDIKMIVMNTNLIYSEREIQLFIVSRC